MLIIADASPLGKDILDNAQKVPTLNGDADSVPALEERIVPTEKDYIDAKIDGVRSELRADVAELRADVRSGQAAMEARHAALEAKLDTLTSSVQSIQSIVRLGSTAFRRQVSAIQKEVRDEARSTRVNFYMGIIGASAVILTGIGLGFGLLIHADNQKTAGITLGAEVQKQLSDTQSLTIKNAEQISDLNDKLDRVLTALEKQPPQQ